MTLPDYVIFSDKITTEVGRLYYDESTRQVIWEIGLLPVSKYQVEAGFNLSVNPVESDRDKIIILSSGSTVSAIESETNGLIVKKTNPKTSKLEDDDISSLSNSGLVQ
jgi:hypothetical protein